MAKKKANRPETKSEFLRRVLGRNPGLEYEQVLKRWVKAGNPGTISNPLFYKVRRDLGIKTVWTWGPAPRVDPTPGEVYQFKVTLLGSNPPIWRRILVRNGSLDQLHEHIQTSMGWTNSHLHHFRVGEKLYGDPRLMAENYAEMGYANSRTTWLSDILPPDGKRFPILYEYDFGDSWEHEVLFEGRSPATPKARYPLCLEGERACPPEDCGGVYGYADFVEAISDPENDQHDDMMEWSGGHFDPDRFDVEAATREMRRGLPDDWMYER